MRKCTSIAVAMIMTAATSTPALATSDSQIWANGSVTVKLSNHWRLPGGEGHHPLQRQPHGLYEIGSKRCSVPPEQGRDRLGRLHPHPAIFGRRLHGDGAPRARAGHLRRLRQTRKGQAERSPAARATVARTVSTAPGGVFVRTSNIRCPIAGKTAINLSTEPFFNLNTTPFQPEAGTRPGTQPGHGLDSAIEDPDRRGRVHEPARLRSRRTRYQRQYRLLRPEPQHLSAIISG